MSKNEKIFDKIRMIHESEKFVIGVLISASFTAIVLLLSFVSSRNIVLDLSIGYLLMSIILNLEAFDTLSSISSNFDQLMNDHQKYMKKIIFYTFFKTGSELFFLIGLLYLFSFFNIAGCSLIIVIYVCYTYLKSSISNIVSYVDNKELPRGSGWEFLFKTVWLVGMWISFISLFSL